ncbi:hypothetical protein [Falsiroseomonas sp.]|uniref:hypothetical protein n=1 Tax=Falsiroseomonas sp. TaxID=2870721 RepID=UPI0027174A82|nr:hypothetical protein [Falsiroseomonas sp.]MDO9499920.1 hypothetical protein [Falsiroseomonas sp.]
MARYTLLRVGHFEPPLYLLTSHSPSSDDPASLVGCEAVIDAGNPRPIGTVEVVAEADPPLGWVHGDWQTLFPNLKLRAPVDPADEVPYPAALLPD